MLLLSSTTNIRDLIIGSHNFSAKVLKIHEICKPNLYFSYNYRDYVWIKVAFASGNLQYQASTKLWRFAENQWDYIGGANSNISSSYSGWIDLFGWGTGNNPTFASTDVYDYNMNFADFFLEGENAINGEQPNAWRTLTGTEWEYRLGDRPNSHSLYGTATVNNVYGLIILPDDWNEPNLSFTSGIKGWDNNVYAVADWKELEYEGAIFLPAAGFRYGNKTDEVQETGCYWSKTDRGYKHEYCLYFTSSQAKMYDYNDYGWRANGHSVRLAKDL